MDQPHSNIRPNTGAEILLQLLLQGFTDEETLILILRCLRSLALRETPGVRYLGLEQFLQVHSQAGAEC